MSDRLPDHLRLLGLCRNPFPPTPDATCYFHSPALECELREAAHCLLARKGFVLLTAEVGMGKSTFVRCLLDRLGAEGVAVSLVFNTFLQGRELLAAILRDFGVAPGAGFDEDIATLNAFLIERWRDGTTCVLVIDDAQNLSLESLELLRLLSNIETGQEKLLQIVLAGQPELRASLDRHEIRQLTSRIVSHIRLTPFDRAETAQYVDFRLARASGTGIALAPRALRALHRRARGNPRRIHLIMDRCLYGVFSERNGEVGRRLVERAAREAGTRTPRRQAPRWRWVALAAVLASLGVLQTTAARLFDRAPPERAHAPALVATAVAAGTPAVPVEDDCIKRAFSARLHVISVPRSQAAALAQVPGVCVAERDERVLVAWHRQLRAEDFMPGRSHASVGLLQNVLAGDHLYRAPIDGLFGPQTQRALADYQDRHALAATGVPDELTLLLIDVAIAAAAAPHAALENAHADG